MAKNIIYFGSPTFSATILESLLTPTTPPYQGGDGEGVYNIVGIVTSPDRPTGRHQKLTPSPVALMASRYDLPIFKPERLDEDNLSHLKLLKPDYFLVVSYGKIIPDNYLATAKTLNIHFSLLPKYRGALCIQEALKNGDSETGVTLMEMETKLDAGPIIAQEKVAIDLDDNVATLTTKLTISAISLLSHPEFISRSIPNQVRDDSEIRIKPTPQNSSLATYTPSLKTLTRQSTFISWDILKSAMRTSPLSPLLVKERGTRGEVLHNLIRSLNPDPGAWTMIDGKEVKILKTSLSKSAISNVQSTMTIELVQLSGKSPIRWKQFLSGNKID